MHLYLVGSCHQSGQPVDGAADATDGDDDRSLPCPERTDSGQPGHAFATVRQNHRHLPDPGSNQRWP